MTPPPTGARCSGRRRPRASACRTSPRRISPGKLSTSSAMNSWARSRSMFTLPSTTFALTAKRSATRAASPCGSRVVTCTTSPPIAAVSAAGVSRATSRPRSRMATRSHAVASSIRCVVRMMDVPSWRRSTERSCQMWFMARPHGSGKKVNRVRKLFLEFCEARIALPGDVCDGTRANYQRNENMKQKDTGSKAQNQVRQECGQRSDTDDVGGAPCQVGLRDGGLEAAENANPLNEIAQKCKVAPASVRMRSFGPRCLAVPPPVRTPRRRSSRIFAASCCGVIQM